MKQQEKIMAKDWQSELVHLKQTKDGTLTSKLTVSLIDAMYLTSKIIDCLNDCGYDLELGLINKSNSSSKE